jgi:hypothetical protein
MLSRGSERPRRGDGIEPAAASARGSPPIGLAPGARDTYLSCMNYVLALLLPPISILIAGRPFVALIVFLIWLPAILMSGGLGHPVFILLAWLIIYQAHADRRARGG